MNFIPLYVGVFLAVPSAASAQHDQKYGSNFEKRSSDYDYILAETSASVSVRTFHNHIAGRSSQWRVLRGYYYQETSIQSWMETNKAS